MTHKKAMWLVLVAGLILLLFDLVVAGQTAIGGSAQQKLFTSPDSSFRFAYPKWFPLCTTEVESCTRSYIPACNHDAMVCVVYPTDAFKGTNFGSAGFQVRVIPKKSPFWIDSADLCATPMPVLDGEGRAQPYTDFLISAEHHGETIGGTLFVHGVSARAAMSHSASTDLYRAFRNGKCYELSVTLTESTYEVYEPGTMNRGR
jgi:hypothetical protein